VNFLADVVRWFTTSAHWHGTNGIPHRLLEHVVLSALVVLSAAAVAVPTGLVLGHVRRGSAVAVNLTNVGRAVPSFAILVLAEQVLGIGAPPAFVALFALALPPMVTNAYAGVRGVDPDIVDAARGMGLSGGQVLRRVEAPLAAPLVMAGVRTAGVQVVATATLAAVIAWGGLGRFIVDGFAQRDNPQVFGGALLVAVLAIVAELALAALQKVVTPRALRAAVSSVPGDSQEVVR